MFLLILILCRCRFSEQFKAVLNVARKCCRMQLSKFMKLWILHSLSANYCKNSPSSQLNLTPRFCHYVLLRKKYAVSYVWKVHITHLWYTHFLIIIFSPYGNIWLIVYIKTWYLWFKGGSDIKNCLAFVLPYFYMKPW